MKKIFTLLAAVVTAVSAWAAAPQLYFGEQLVKNGATYRTGYELEAMDLGVMVMNRYVQNSNLFIEGNKGEALVVEVKATHELAVCSIDGSCVMGTDVVKEGPMPAGRTSLEIHNEANEVVMSGMTPPDPSTLLPEITCRVKVYYKSQPGDAVEVTVILTNLSADEVTGLVSVASPVNAVKLIGNTLEYNFEQPTKLDIYGISGALIMSRKVANHGSISLEALRPGIYLYSAAGKSGKIVIRK